MKPLLYILSIFFLLTTCKEDKKDQFARLVQEWQGKEIVFPQDMAFTRFVTEPMEYRIPDAEYKVLIYVDSTGCTSCKLQLPKWKELIAHVDSATNSNIPFIFVFQSKDDRELRYILKQLRPPGLYRPEQSVRRVKPISARDYLPDILA